MQKETNATASHVHEQEHSVLSTVLSTIPHSVFWKDCDLVYLGCNRVFAENAGLSSTNDMLDSPTSTCLGHAKKQSSSASAIGVC